MANKVQLDAVNNLIDKVKRAKKKTSFVRINEIDEQHLKEMAKERGVTYSAYLRAVIQNFISDNYGK